MKSTSYGFFDLFLAVGPRLRPEQFVKPCLRESRHFEERSAALEAGTRFPAAIWV
jgi:hypothetical protein